MGEYDNVIYEIYNEPLDISWSETVKPYAISVIAAIREIDADEFDELWEHLNGHKG